MNYRRADNEVVELVQAIAEQHHQRLDGAKIAVVMREKATESKGQVVLATAQIPPENIKPLLDDNYHFVIFIAEDKWVWLSEHQRRALIDHELCHCCFDGEPSLRGHDYEEFAQVVDRHGLWRKTPTEKAVQTAFLKSGVKIGTLKS